MSAFLVSRETIDVMVNAAIAGVHDHGLRWWDGESHHVAAMGPNERTPGEVGAMLWAENAASVNARYREDELEPVYEHKVILASFAPVEVLKTVACYEYQSCEHNDWPESEARAFCEALRGKYIHRLEGWDAAPWDWSSRDLHLRGVGTRQQIRDALGGAQS